MKIEATNKTKEKQTEATQYKAEAKYYTKQTRSSPSRGEGNV